MNNLNFKNPIIITIVIAMTLIILLTIVNILNNTRGKLVSPEAGIPGQITSPSPSAAYNPPKEIKYDSSTDLKQELKNIDPKVLDSDFEDL